MKEHKSEVESKKADSEITEISKHARNWKTSEISKVEKKNKFSLQKNLLVRESLEIKKHNSVFNGYNDPQLVVITNSWNPPLKDLKKIEPSNNRRGT